MWYKIAQNNSISENPRQYTKLVNFAVAILKEIKKDEWWEGELEDIIYDFFARNRIDANETELQQNPNFQRYQELHENIEPYIYNGIKNKDLWRQNSNPHWISFSKSGTAEPENRNFKMYQTIAHPFLNKREFINGVINIINEITDLNSEYKISVKLPRKFEDFNRHADTLVIHYADQSLKPTIDEITTRNLEGHTYDRTKLYRTTHGRDTDRTSDTRALAESMAYNLRFMKKDGKLAKDIMIEGFEKNGIDWLIRSLMSFWDGINRRAFHRN
jgi:hypothetical protein